MPFRANQQLREDIWDYRNKSSAGPSAAENENTLSSIQSANFTQSAAKDYGTTALNLVHQAAELMENHARETEARADLLCKNFAEKLQRAAQAPGGSEGAQFIGIFRHERVGATDHQETRGRNCASSHSWRGRSFLPLTRP